MAKTPVSMTIDGYKEREVRMDDRAQPPEERRDQVSRDKDKQGDEVNQVHQRLLRSFRGEVGGQDGTLRGDYYHL